MAAVKTKLTPKTIGTITDAIAIGATKEIAAQYAHISVSSLMHWLQLARKDEDAGIVDPAHRLHLKLLHAIDDAEGEAAIKWVQVVNAAAEIEPSWAWRMLERRYPDGFAPPKQVVDLNVIEITADELAEARRKAAEFDAQLEGGGDG